MTQNNSLKEIEETETAFLIRIALEHPTDSPDYKRLIFIAEAYLDLREKRLYERMGEPDHED